MRDVRKSLWLAAVVAGAFAGGQALTRIEAAGAQEPAAAPQAPVQATAPVFRPGVTLAFVDTTALASGSRLGQSFAAELDSLRERKNTELTAKRQELQAAQQTQQTNLSVTDAARAALQRDIDRIGRELQFMTEGAQAEMESLQQDVQRRFDAALGPVLEQVATTHGLHMVFGRAESGLVWANPALDLTAEVIKALDAVRAPGQ